MGGRGRLRALGAGIGVSVAIYAAPSLGAPSARLTYERSAGAESCPDEGVLRRAIEQRLGYDPFFPWADRTIVARISGEARALGASIELLDAAGIVRGSRKLSAPDGACSELVSGMALAISIAIDPSSVDRSASPSTGVAAEGNPSVAAWSSARAEEAAVAPAADQAAPKPAPRRPATVERGPTVTLQGGASAAAGLGPAPLLGPTLGAALSWGSWGFGFDGRYLFGFDATYGAAHVASSLLEAALVGCFRPGAFFGCAEGSIGRLGISGTGVTRENTDAAFIERLGVRGGVDVAFSADWAVELSADLLFNLAHQTVVVDDKPVWDSDPVGGLVTLAVRRRFP